jgi:hypothetical protein
MRPVVIVLLDPAGDAVPRFFQAAILRRPDFLFLQAAMEPFDVAVAFRVMIGRAAVDRFRFKSRVLGGFGIPLLRTPPGERSRFPLQGPPRSSEGKTSCGSVDNLPREDV